MTLSRRVLARATLRVGLSSAGEVVGRAVNVMLPFALFAVHGIGTDTDRFFLALAVGFFVQGTLANAVASGLVPELVDDREPRSLAAFVAAAGGAGASAGIFAVALVGISPVSLAGAVTAVAIAVLGSAGLIAAPAVAVLNAEHRYGAPGLTWSLRIVPIALYLLWQPGFPLLHWLLAGLAAADAARGFILLRLAGPRLHFGRGRRLHFPRTALHLMLGSAIAGLVPLALRSIAAAGASGSVSQFEAAERVYGAVASLATIGVGNVALVYLARLRGTSDETAGWRMILQASLLWSMLWLTACVALWAAFPLVAPWLRLPDANGLADVRNTFLALAFGMPGFIITGMFGRRMLTAGLAARFVPVTSAGVTFAIGSGWLLFPVLGSVGLGVAVAGSQYVVSSLMYVALQRRERRAHPRAV